MSAGERIVTTDTGAASGSAVEQHHVEIIPENERHGRPRDQFTLWFAAKANVVNFTLGVLAIEFGLNLFWALVGIVVGPSFPRRRPRSARPQRRDSRPEAVCQIWHTSWNTSH